MLQDEAQGVVNSLVTDFKKRDEFGYFREVVVKIKNANPTALHAIVECLPQAKKGYLTSILQSYRVALNADGTESVTRKMVTVKAKKTGNINFQNTGPQ